MIDSIFNYLAALLLIIGGLFSVIAAIGIIRLPDIFSRSHAASKAGTIGSGLVMLALAFQADDISTVTRALAGLGFFLLTAPLSAHLLARAALFAGYKLDPSSVVNDMAHKAKSIPD